MGVKVEKEVCAHRAMNLDALLMPGPDLLRSVNGKMELFRWFTEWHSFIDSDHRMASYELFLVAFVVFCCS